MADDGGAAFPRHPGSGGDDGMTLLDYFAAKAMASFLYEQGEAPDEKVAAWAYHMAAAMLAEKNRRGREADDER